MEIGNSLYFSCHFQFACERGSEKAKAEFNLGKKRSARRPQWEPLLLWFKDDCILYYLFVCIAYLLRILMYFYMETFHSAALIKKKKTSLRSHMDKQLSLIERWAQNISVYSCEETNRHFQIFRFPKTT